MAMLLFRCKITFFLPNSQIITTFYSQRPTEPSHFALILCPKTITVWTHFKVSLHFQADFSDASDDLRALDVIDEEGGGIEGVKSSRCGSDLVFMKDHASGLPSASLVGQVQVKGVSQGCTVLKALFQNEVEIAVALLLTESDAKADVVRLWV